MNADHPLDNPVWHALTGPQAWAAEGTGEARRYHPDVSVFAAVADSQPNSWTDLFELVGVGGYAVLFRHDAPTAPEGWRVVTRMDGFQMVLEGEPRPQGDPPTIVALGISDVPAMAELVERTNPGPFTVRTIELGSYFGVFDDGRLVAMAGERMRLPGYTEISAVCTDAAARGRGLGGHLTAHVARHIAASDSVPFLHVVADNPARTVYESLGFTIRQVNKVTIAKAVGETGG